MSSSPNSDSREEADASAGRATGALQEQDVALPILGVRSALGGVLMGLANLVPGISGGTMLLAAGVYPAFIGAIADLSTLRIRVRPIFVVGVIAGSAAVAILLLAGWMKDLVIHQRWIMYSLFIGLTLGGVPLVWRLARPASAGVVAGAIAAFGLMLLMQLSGGAGGSGTPSTLLLFVSGLAGASAMILPGVSGGYLLLLLGQYERILGAIDQLKVVLLESGGIPAIADLMEPAGVVIPVGIGVVVGIVGVSNLLKWLLARFEKPTLGALLGLLFGAVVGLWPFQQPVEPAIGDTIEGQIVTAGTLAEIDPEDWDLEIFDPTAGQAGGAIALILAGLGTTLLIDRVGGGGREEDEGAR